MKAFFAAGILLGVAATGTQAQRPGGGPPRLVLQALDTDKDGTLSAAEIAAAPKTLLSLDRSGDGQLTPDELSARPENAGATADELVQQLLALDKNGDGVLTKDEVPARMQTMFTRGDTNNDGKLTQDEIRTMARRQGMPSGGADGIKRMSAMFKNDPLLNALDSDHDGIISAAETAAAPQALLTLDANHDGQITPDEMRPHQQTPEERVDHMLDEWDTNKDGKIAKAEAPDRMQGNFDALDKNGDGFLDRGELLEYFKSMGSGPRGNGPQGGPQPGNAPGAPKGQN